MAITNAQQYQQLVNKRADGKRPGYRGDDAARSSEGTSGGRADPGGAGRGDTRGDPGPPDRSAVQAGSQYARAVAREQRIKDMENYIDRPSIGFTDAAKYNLLSPKSIGSGIFSYATGLPFLGSILNNMGTFDNKQFVTDKVLKSKNPQDYDEDDYEDYMSARMKGDIDAY